MKLKPEATTSFARGINDSATATRYRSDEAAAMHNFRIAPDGAAEVRYGSRRAHTTAVNLGAQCYGFTKRPFVTAAGAKLWVGFFGDSVYVSDDEWESYTLVATGLRQDYWSLNTMRMGSTTYLLCVNGGASGYKYDGTTWSAISGLPSGAKVGAVFNGRFYVAGHSGPVVQGSRIADFEDWSASKGVVVQAQTHDGDEEVVGLYQLGTHLLVFKRHSTNWSEGYGQTDIIVAAGALGLSRSVGCLGWRTIQAVGDQGVMWLSDRGLEMYVPGKGIRLVSDRVQEFFRSIAWGDLIARPELSDAVWVSSKSEYRCAIPAAGGQNTHELVYNAITGGTTFFSRTPEDGGTVYVEDGEFSFSAEGDRQQVRIIAGELSPADSSEVGLYVNVVDGEPELASDNSAPACLFVADRGGEVNDAPCSAAYDGFVRYLDEGDLDDVLSDGSGGVAISARLRTAPRLWGTSGRKWARVVRILGVVRAAASITVGIIADGVERVTRTKTLPAASDKQPQEVLIRTSVRGTTIQEEIRTSEAGLRIALVETHAEVLKDRF